MDYVAHQIVLNLKKNRTRHIKVFCKEKHHAHSYFLVVLLLLLAGGSPAIG